MTNAYCTKLGISVPRLDDVKDQRDACTYSLLIVALLERGEPMTLEGVARRFEAAGVAPAAGALRSLTRCRPARAPVYRDGDRYSLDPFDHDLDLWAFRLGLKPPRSSVRPPARPEPEPEPEPLPGPDMPLAQRELEETFRDGSLWDWSALRVAIAVLDAAGQPLAPADVVARAGALSASNRLSTDSARYWRKKAVRVGNDGKWELDTTNDAVRAARQAVRDRLAKVRSWGDQRPDPATVAARIRAFDERRARHARELAKLRTVLIHAFPAKNPAAAVLVDVGRRQLTTFFADDFGELRTELDRYDVLGAVDARPQVRVLGLDPEERRLAELGPPQKTMTVNRRGRTLNITLPLLVTGTCGIGRPFGDQRKLRKYLRNGETTRLRRRLEADAKSLFAYYNYGRLHGCVRLLWGFLDECLPVPWHHPDEPTVRDLLWTAIEQGLDVEIVYGSAPGWAEPWARARRCTVERGVHRYDALMFDDRGRPVRTREIQLARLAAATR